MFLILKNQTSPGFYFYLFLFIDIKISTNLKKLNIIIIIIIIFNFFRLVDILFLIVYKILSLSIISTPTPLDNIKECKIYYWIWII
jgi:hypothetical protein